MSEPERVAVGQIRGCRPDRLPCGRGTSGVRRDRTAAPPARAPRRRSTRIPPPPPTPPRVRVVRSHQGAPVARPGALARSAAPRRRRGPATVTSARRPGPAGHRRSTSRATPPRTAGCPRPCRRSPRSRRGGPPPHRGGRAARIRIPPRRGTRGLRGRRPPTRDGGRAAPSWPGRYDEHRYAARPLHDVAQEIEERLLAPVDIVEDEDERLPSREPLEESTDGPETLLCGPRCSLAQPDELGDTIRDAIGALDALEERRDPASGLLRRVFVGDRRYSADGLRHRPVGDALAVRETASAQDDRPIHRSRRGPPGPDATSRRRPTPRTVTSRQVRSATKMRSNASTIVLSSALSANHRWLSRRRA